MKSKLKQELKKHRVIQLNLKDKLCYYLHNQLGNLFLCGRCCWGNRKQMTRLIDEAQDRLDGELNIIKIIQSLRNMKVLLKSSIMTDEIRFKIMHSQKNFIDLDQSASSSSDSTSSSECHSHDDANVPESSRALNHDHKAHHAQ